MFLAYTNGYVSDGKCSCRKINMKQKTVYDNTPFEDGYSSKQEIIANMNPLLEGLIEKNAGRVFYDIGCGCGRNLVMPQSMPPKLLG